MSLNKNYLSVLVMAGLAVSIASGAVAEDKDKPLSKDDVKEIVREYIMDHPEVMMESFDRKQKREMEDRQAKAKENIGKKKDEIFGNPLSPVAGNPKGDVTVVEFFDYNCGYCKRILPTITEVIANDKNLKVVFKELPILGPTSELAAKFALGVNKVDKSKYFEFHTELMKMSGEKTEASLLEIVKKIGLKEDKVKEAANSKEVTDYMNELKKLAGEIGVQGTPAFVVGEEFIPGAIDKTALEDLIKRTREGKKGEKK